MDFEKLINFILNNPKNISIEYSNINGEEKLVINGEEIKEEESFDDSKIKEEVKNYKDIVENLDDCLFLEIVEDMSEKVDVKTFDELLEQDSYTEDEAEIVSQMMNITKTVIYEHVVQKIQDLKEILEQI